LPCAVIAVQRGSEFLSLFVTVSFLKVRARPNARKDVSIRSQLPHESAPKAFRRRIPGSKGAPLVIVTNPTARHPTSAPFPPPRALAIVSAVIVPNCSDSPCCRFRPTRARRHSAGWWNSVVIQFCLAPTDRDLRSGRADSDRLCGKLGHRLKRRV
jgi:hypothetical protein